MALTPTELLRLQRDLDVNQDDNDLRGVVADALEDAGKMELVVAHRWMLATGRRPVFDDGALMYLVEPDGSRHTKRIWRRVVKPRVPGWIRRGVWTWYSETFLPRGHYTLPFEVWQAVRDDRPFRTDRKVTDKRSSYVPNAYTKAFTVLRNAEQSLGTALIISGTV